MDTFLRFHLIFYLFQFVTLSSSSRERSRKKNRQLESKTRQDMESLPKYENRLDFTMHEYLKWTKVKLYFVRFLFPYPLKRQLTPKRFVHFIKRNRQRWLKTEEAKKLKSRQQQQPQWNFFHYIFFSDSLLLSAIKWQFGHILHLMESKISLHCCENRIRRQHNHNIVNKC